MHRALNYIGRSVWLLGPLAVCGSTTLLAVRATGHPLSRAGTLLFAAGVVTTYALDHWADLPRTRRPQYLLWLAGLAAIMGLLAAVWLPWGKIALAGALGMVGLFYRKLKKWPLSKTLFVAGAWTVAGVCFPIDWQGQDLFFAPFGGALLAIFTAGALLCDFKDCSTDAQAGVRTAVVLWGPRMAALTAAILALGGVVVAVTAGRPGLVAAGVALAALAASPKLISRPVLGPALVDGALALPALLILTGLA